MNRFRKKYKKIGKRKVKTIRKKDVLKMFTINKISVLENENMIKKYKVKNGIGKHSKYLFRIIVTTVDEMILKFEIIRKYGGKK